MPDNSHLIIIIINKRKAKSYKFMFWFRVIFFRKWLSLRFNILLADMNSLSCKMFMFRLSGAQVRWS